jgi:hypothetical protein
LARSRNAKDTAEEVQDTVGEVKDTLGEVNQKMKHLLLHDCGHRL